MTARDINAFLSADLDKVRRQIAVSLDSDIDLLNQTNRSILEHGGKFLRPIVAILVAKACSGGYVAEDTYRYAAAAELLHNATLLHDDVADDSTSRRGVPTVMSLLGSRAAVLLGDYWLVKAMDNIFSGTTDTNRVLRIFSRTLSDLAEGEMLQLQKADGGDTTEADYYRIIYNKTASLFVAAAICAAISVGVPKETEEAVREYAVNLGLAFQIRDDILDYIGDEKLGKPVGQDLMEQKMTLPLLGAYAVCPGREAEIRSKVSSIGSHPEYQAEIVSYVLDNGGIKYAEDRLGEYLEKALAALSVLPADIYRDCLEGIARYTGAREK